MITHQIDYPISATPLSSNLTEFYDLGNLAYLLGWLPSHEKKSILAWLLYTIACSFLRYGEHDTSCEVLNFLKHVDNNLSELLASKLNL
jgi:hypothetical protein